MFYSKYKANTDCCRGMIKEVEPALFAGHAKMVLNCAAVLYICCTFGNKYFSCVNNFLHSLCWYCHRNSKIENTSFYRLYFSLNPSNQKQTNKMAWHKGTWWPLFVKEWYAPKSSQHMFDPYSFCLVVLGLVFHLLWGTDDIDYWIYGFLAAILLELGLEVVGNSQFVLKRIRNNSGTSGEYIGKLYLWKPI